jgi:hypothetical protein
MPCWCRRFRRPTSRIIFWATRVWPAGPTSSATPNNGDDWDNVQRLRFDSVARFRPGDVGRPLDIAWNDASPTALETRSGVTIRWRALARVTVASRPKRPFVLRLFHVFIVALAAAIGLSVVLASAANVPFPQLAASALLLVPMLPFFVCTSQPCRPADGYVRVAFGAQTMFLDGRRSHLAGMLVGLGIFIACSSSRSARRSSSSWRRWRPAGARHARRRVAARSAVTFWAARIGGLALFYLIVSPSYLASCASRRQGIRVRPVRTRCVRIAGGGVDRRSLRSAPRSAWRGAAAGCDTVSAAGDVDRAHRVCHGHRRHPGDAHRIGVVDLRALLRIVLLDKPPIDEPSSRRCWRR